MRDIAEEVVAEVFANFCQGRVYEKGIASYPAYLYQAVRYRAYNYLKYELNRSVPLDALHARSNPEELLRYNDLSRKLDGLVQNLPRSAAAADLGVLLPSQKFLDNFEEGDLRKGTIIFDGGGRFRPQIVKYILPFTRPALGTKVTPRDAEADNNLIIYRLAGIILLRAEALNNLGRMAEAIPLLNQIRARAALPPTTATSQAQLKAAILKERGYELSFEGHRWFDLVRNGEALNEIPSLKSPDRLLLPISQREIILNNSIDKNNPGY